MIIKRSSWSFRLIKWVTGLPFLEGNLETSLCYYSFLVSVSMLLLPFMFFIVFIEERNTARGFLERLALGLWYFLSMAFLGFFVIGYFIPKAWWPDNFPLGLCIWIYPAISVGIMIIKIIKWSYIFFVEKIQPKICVTVHIKDE